MSQSSQWNGQKQKESKKTKWHQCHCGKKYQTSTSLNNHIKNRHPEQNANANRAANKPSRGRPKQYQYKQLEQKSNSQPDPLLELKQIQQKVGDSDIKGKQLYQSQPVFFNLIGPFMEEEDKENVQDLKFVQEDKIYEVTMGRGLSILIKQLKAKIQKEQFLHQVILLITIYISYVIEQTEDQNVLKNGSIGLLPQFANIFILYDLSKRCQRLKLTSLWISKPQITISVLNIIFRWLIFKQFTHTTALVNEQFMAGQEQSEVQQDKSQ